jgi:hypothetical protein
MGGFSAQVQQPTNPPQAGGGKGIANQVAQVASRSDGLDQNAIDADPQGFQKWQQQRAQYSPQPMAKGGNYQSNATSGQPRMGQQNPYPNTVGQWDNAQIQPVRQQGKGKGA